MKIQIKYDTEIKIAQKQKIKSLCLIRVCLWQTNEMNERGKLILLLKKLNYLPANFCVTSLFCMNLVDFDS